MITPNKKSGFYIGVSCPGCGGELEVQSDFFVLACTHCGSSLRIIMPGTPPAYMIKSAENKRTIRFQIDRYLKKNSMPLTSSQFEIKSVYTPYWKIDAVVLKVRNTIIEHMRVGDDYNNYGYGGGEQTTTYEQKITDIRLVPFTITQIATERKIQFPFSLGMRTEYIKMIPFADENIDDEFECLPAIKEWSQVIDDLDNNASSVNELSAADFGINKTEIFHPVGSIVYFPYFVVESPHGEQMRQFIVDGISGRVLKYSTELLDYDIEKNETPGIEFGELGIEFHRCPNCGEDLPSRQSFVYICDNCQELVLLEKYSFVENQIFSAPSGGNPNDRMFPFWSMKLSGEHQEKIRKMFGGIYNSDRLVLPGFKLPNFEAMFRLSKRMSAAAAKLDLSPIEKLERHFMPVNLSLTEALTLAEVLIYRDSIGKGMKQSFREAKFSPEQASLFYAPFHPESYFYVDSVLGAVTFEKNLVE